MKIKIVLIGIYMAFISVALFQWLQTRAIIESQRAAIEGYDRMARANNVSSSDYAMRILKLARGEAWVGLDVAQRNRFFIFFRLH